MNIYKYSTTINNLYQFCISSMADFINPYDPPTRIHALLWNKIIMKLYFKYI